MEVITNSERVVDYRKKILELLFTERNHVCSVCVVNGNCELQALATELGMTHVHYEYLYPRQTIDARHMRNMPVGLALIASAKACDEILGIRIPSTGTKLRRLLSCASYIQSHALSFFHLSFSPDLVLGMDCDPATRNIVGVMNANKPLALDGIQLRKIGQQIIEWFAGKRVPTRPG